MAQSCSALPARSRVPLLPLFTCFGCPCQIWSADSSVDDSICYLLGFGLIDCIRIALFMSFLRAALVHCISIISTHELVNDSDFVHAVWLSILLLCFSGNEVCEGLLKGLDSGCVSCPAFHGSLAEHGGAD